MIPPLTASPENDTLASCSAVVGLRRTLIPLPTYSKRYDTVLVDRLSLKLSNVAPRRTSYTTGGGAWQGEMAIELISKAVSVDLRRMYKDDVIRERKGNEDVVVPILWRAREPSGLSSSSPKAPKHWAPVSCSSIVLTGMGRVRGSIPSLLTSSRTLPRSLSQRAAEQGRKTTSSGCFRGPSQRLHSLLGYSTVKRSESGRSILDISVALGPPSSRRDLQCLLTGDPHRSHRFMIQTCWQPGSPTPSGATDPAHSESDDDAPLTQRPTHDVTHVPLRSALKRAGQGGGTRLVVDDAGYPPVAFSAGLPGGIQLSELPDPRNVHKALLLPGTQLSKDEMATRPHRELVGALA
jgi:hypothetical protein